MIPTINSDLDPSSAIIKQMIADMREQNEAINKGNRAFLDDFYHNRQGKDEYLKDKGFTDVKIPLHWINITKKIIDKISLVYKNPPDRSMGENSNYIDWIAEHPKFDISLQVADQLKNLFHNVLFRPVYFKGKFNFWIEEDFIPFFKEGDPLEPIGYAIPLRRETTQTNANKISERQWWAYWSDDYYYWFDDDGIIKPDPDYPDMVNPYGKIPMIEMRKEMAVNEYWPEGAMDLAKANQAINVALNNLNYTLYFQSFNQPYVSGVSEDQAQNLVFGQNKIIGLPETESSIGLLNYSPAIAQAVDAIRSQIEMIGNMYNVNIKGSLEGSAPSGFSLLVQNIDLMESRENDVKYCKMYEKEIYDIIQIQDEVLNLGYKLPKRDKNNKLTVDFQDINFPINAAEEREDKDWNLDHNIISVVDIIQANNPDMTEEEAIEKWEKNKALNETYTFQQQIIKDELKKEEVIIEP